MIAPAALPNSPQVSDFEAIRDPGVPAVPGTYALVMLASAELSLKAGRLDAAILTPGLYIASFSLGEALLQLVELIQRIQWTERVHVQGLDLREDRVLP